MGKKKRSNQSSNSTVNCGDSSESESSKDSSQVTEVSKPSCAHLKGSVDTNAVRKTIKNNVDKNVHFYCSTCKKNEATPCKEGWVCLRCGDYNCGPDEADHRVKHYDTPRSDNHFLAYHFKTNIIWCFKCKLEIPVDKSSKVQCCADIIKKQYNDHMPFNSVTFQTDTKKMNGVDSANFLKEGSSGQPLQNGLMNKSGDKPVLDLPKVKGLMNLGNTCFFNSVLQCLAQTPGLVSLLREMDVPGEKFNLELDGIKIDAVLEKVKSSNLSEQLAVVLTNVSGPSPGGISTVNPRLLLSALTSKCPQFEGGDQHDAHELLRHLLDSVHTEDLRRYQKAILEHIGYYNKKEKELEDEKISFGKKLNHKVCETIPIRPDQIFKGSLVSILECKTCGNISKREETFLDLSLPVAQEKAQPPVLSRRKQSCNSPVEENQNTEVTMSKHQLKKEKKNARRNRKLNRSNGGNKKEQNQGEPTIEEEDKKDSIDGDQSDADVEDNEDTGCGEADQKMEVVESGYSSEKQASARGSPVMTQSNEDESKECKQEEEAGVYRGCALNPTSEVSAASRAESGLGSIQELSVTIPDETNLESTSQDSVRVNASNGSPDISSDSQHGNFKNIDLSSSFQLPPSSDSQVDRTTMVYDWNCTGDAKSHSQDSSSVSLSVSPQYGSRSSQENNSPVSGSHSNDNMSACTSLPNSNDNMSVCNSLPENISMILNSPVKSQCSQREEDNSDSEERPMSRMECHKNRSSPVELGEPTEIDSDLLHLSLQGMKCEADREDSDNAARRASPERISSPDKPSDFQNSLVVSAGNKNPIPLPPPVPSFSAPYSFTHPEPAMPMPRVDRYKAEEGECSLQSCLGQFTMIELLAGGNKVGCEACTERENKGNKDGKTVYQNSTKQLLICKLPPIMIFHLKRFQVQKFMFRKLSRHVDFPLVLDISPFCFRNEGKGDEPVLYSLYGVVEHMGTLHGGHYVAYVKVRPHGPNSPGVQPPGKWYYVSDSRVSDVDESAVLKSQAYLLFYERIL